MPNDTSAFVKYQGMLKQVNILASTKPDDMEEMANQSDLFERWEELLKELSGFVMNRKEYAKVHIEHLTRVQGYQDALEAIEKVQEFIEEPLDEGVRGEVLEACDTLLDFIDEYAPELDDAKIAERL